MKKWVLLSLLIALIPINVKAYPNGPYAAVLSIRNIYSSVNVTTGAWVQLVASMGVESTRLEIFDSSGQTLELGIGRAGSEVHKIYLFPGGNGTIDFSIHIGDRVSIRAVSANATAGELDLNFYQGP